jgi:hypothetical protein
VPDGGSGPAGCAPGLTDCFGVCADLTSDGANCGYCGNGCLAGTACIGGRCQSLAASEPGVTDVLADLDPCGSQGLADCGGSCVDLAANDYHCGACDNSCGLGGDCQGGVCVFLTCPAGQVRCGDSFCIDLSSDPYNCGACGFRCGDGHVCCSGHCKDLSSDPDNCGACRRACFEPLIGSPTCSNFSCI